MDRCTIAGLRLFDLRAVVPVELHQCLKCLGEQAERACILLRALAAAFPDALFELGKLAAERAVHPLAKLLWRRLLRHLPARTVATRRALRPPPRERLRPRTDGRLADAEFPRDILDSRGARSGIRYYRSAGGEGFA